VEAGRVAVIEVFGTANTHLEVPIGNLKIESILYSDGYLFKGNK
jgi:hypothetical protein